MIQSFKCPDTLALFTTGKSRRFAVFANEAMRKLQQLDAAHEIRDLASPPGNRLEPLTGNRAGQYSVRVNDQWRVCFVWTHTGPKDVEIVDYH
jgi:proteic killer suppression protein